MGRVFDEASLVQERVNGRIVTEAELTKLAVTGILSKEARTQFSKLAKQLSIEVKPRPEVFE